MPTSHEFRTESTTDRVLDFERSGDGAAVVLYVHGIPQAAFAWDPVIAESTTANMELVRLDLAGMGSRTHDRGPFTLERFTADVVAVIDHLNKPVVIVAHSMATQVAELAAVERPGFVRALALVAPLPLGGFAAPGEDPPTINAQATRAASVELFRGLGEVGSKLAEAAERVRAEALQAMFDAAAAGHSAGRDRSEFAGPVLLMPGENDEVVPPGLVESYVRPRFEGATTIAIANAGHEAHLQQPRTVAAAIDGFLSQLSD